MAEAHVLILVKGPVAGEVTLYGSMVKGDQGGYLWTVSDTDARKLWSFELQGIPEALKVSFTVYDTGGNEVIIGQVGGAPVELEQGYYRVGVWAKFI